MEEIKLLNYVENTEKYIGEKTPEGHGFIRFSQVDAVWYGYWDKPKYHENKHTHCCTDTSWEEEVYSIEETSDEYNESDNVEEKISESSFHR